MHTCADRRDRRAARRGGRTRGAALAVALVLLLGLTVLAVISVRGAREDAERAASAMAHTTAFEVAERAISVALAASPAVSGARTARVPATGTLDEGASYRIDFDATGGITAVPEGFSLDADTGFKAYHYTVTAIGISAERRVALRQGFYVIGPPDG